MNKFAESQAGEINALAFCATTPWKNQLKLSAPVRLKPTNRCPKPTKSLAGKIATIRGLSRARDRQSRPCRPEVLRKDEIGQERSPVHPSCAVMTQTVARREIRSRRRSGWWARRQDARHLFIPILAPAMSICSDRCNHAIAEDQSHEIRFACGLTAGHRVDDLLEGRQIPRDCSPRTTQRPLCQQD